MDIPPPPAPEPPAQPGQGHGPGWPPPAPGPQQPWYPYPQPYAQPYPQPFQEPARTSGLAIASLVTGIVCCVPPLGLVLGAVALRQIRKHGQGGKGMAITGVVLSSISTVLAVVLVVSGAASAFWDGFRDGLDEVKSTRSTMDLRKGDCFDVPGGELEREVENVIIVPCGKPHDGEVSGSFKLEGSSFPGDKAITALADRKCWAVEQEYAMDSWALPVEAESYYYTPSTRSWRLGDHSVTCSFATTSGKLTGSVRNDARRLDADQMTYLRSSNAYDRVLATGPDRDRVEDDLPAFKKWAGQVSQVLGQESARLRQRSWPASAQAQVGARAKEAELAGKEWAKAAGAADAEAFYLHSGAADRAMRQATEVAARSALHLATTPPATDSGGSSGGSGGADGGTDSGGTEDGPGSGTGSGSGSDGSKAV
ncbi:DUF4190 domain-containing protein [Streptomyces sp. TLI_146]|uniref:DUF4190 domain-containing protein n=1 Tax=Streptomyces sp. TLI_146 TaxID=1938858 RepID=UPI000C7114C3|nr:DUF4190 domain-containing protein [Streptomyces sp. TLI_146]PKV87618.1 putative regulator of septum formation [Streptomyces sp. TLI_146]